MSLKSLFLENRKAVWAAREAMVLAVALLLGSTSAFAEGPHGRSGAKLAPGAPNAQAHRRRQVPPGSRS